MTDVSGSLETALAYLDALGGDDPDAVADLVAADFLNEHQSELGSGCVGRDEYRRRLAGFLAGFPNRCYRVVEVAVGALSGSPSGADGTDEIVVRYRFEADVDGHRIDIPGVMWISVRNREITRRIDTWDSLTFLRQTGSAPPQS